MTGAVAIANPALVKKKAMAKTPAARLRSERFGGLGGAAPARKSVFGLGSFGSAHLENFVEKDHFENPSCG
jgi:hypothetical protein